MTLRRDAVKAAEAQRDSMQAQLAFLRAGATMLTNGRDMTAEWIGQLEGMLERNARLLEFLRSDA